MSITSKKNWKEDLYHEYASFLVAVAYRYTHDLHDAEDVVHDSFIYIFENINKYRGEGQIGAWMRRIVVNQSINRFKHKIQFSDIDGQLDVKDEKEDDYLDFKPTAAQLEKAINELPFGYKEVFNMYLIDGLSHKEIGEILKISEVTSRTQFLRAKKLLKKKLTKE